MIFHMYMYIVCLLRFYYAMVDEAREAYGNRPVCVGVCVCVCVSLFDSFVPVSLQRLKTKH